MVQFAGAALQTAEDVDEKVAQGIGRYRQPAQFVATVDVHPFAEVAAGELGDMLDQAGDRGDQRAVEQPQAEQADQQAGAEHDQGAEQYGAIGGAVDGLSLLLALRVQ